MMKNVSEKRDIENLKQKTDRIDLIIENEIRVNIQRVGELHFDTLRNLHGAMKASGEAELLGVKLRMLESDVRALKHKVS